MCWSGVGGLRAAVAVVRAYKTLAGWSTGQGLETEVGAKNEPQSNGETQQE